MYSVYIADDEMWVIVGLKKRIEKTGLPFQVIGEANNGVMALEEIEKKKPAQHPPTVCEDVALSPTPAGQTSNQL